MKRVGAARVTGRRKGGRIIVVLAHEGRRYARFLRRGVVDGNLKTITLRLRNVPIVLRPLKHTGTCVNMGFIKSKEMPWYREKLPYVPSYERNRVEQYYGAVFAPIYATCRPELGLAKQRHGHVVSPSVAAAMRIFGPLEVSAESKTRTDRATRFF